MAIKVFLSGCKGRMGQAIQNIADPDTFDFCCKIDMGDDVWDGMKAADVVVDFSHHDVTARLVEKANACGIPVVIGTTGHTPAEREQILSFSKTIPLMWSGNYSIGMNMLFYLTRKAAEALPELWEPEITEIHHHFKKDAPSGTAIDLARRVCQGRDWDFDNVVINGREGMTGERPAQQIGIHALRGGDVVGEHTVSFFGDGERVQLKHLATDRKILARGALLSTKWIVGKAPGLYEMQDVLGLR